MKVDTNFKEIQESVCNIYNNIITKFCIYSKGLPNVSLTSEEAEQLLLSFLNYNQLDLYGSTSELVLPNLAGLSDQQRFLVGSFINIVVNNDPKIKEDFNTIIVGYMLANAIFLPDQNNLQAKFHGTSFYFDTSFLLHALGYDGITHLEPTLELIDLLRIHKAKLFCFKHTLDEIKGILYACSEKLKIPRKMGATKIESDLLLKGKSPSDVLVEIIHLEAKLANLNIKIIEKPNYENHSINIDEEGLKEEINSIINYQSEIALKRDIDSISSIYRLRRDRFSQSIENCVAIFVTTNNKLSLASNNFFFSEKGHGLIPPCINDFSLTTILWLKTPITRPKLPFVRIIADSVAAVQPTKDFLTKWFTEIEKLYQGGEINSEEEYYYFKHAPEIHTLIMEKTSGNSQLINYKNVSKMINEARIKLQKDISKDFNEKLVEIPVKSHTQSGVIRTVKE